MIPKAKKLDPIINRNLKLIEDSGYGFAKAITQVPISHIEFFDVAREYPIVFLPDQSVPVALTGLQENGCLIFGGKWRCKYIPTHLRAYPFSFSRLPKEDGDYEILYITNAPQISVSEGNPLFTPSGEPTGTLRQRRNLLTQMKTSESTTRQFTNTLRRLDVLRPATLYPTLEKELSSMELAVEMIDEAKLRKLTLIDLDVLKDQDYLGLVYAQIISTGNFSSLGISIR